MTRFQISFLAPSEDQKLQAIEFAAASLAYDFEERRSAAAIARLDVERREIEFGAFRPSECSWDSLTES